MAKKAYVYNGSAWVEITSQPSVPTATTGNAGITQLTDSISSTSTSTAATPNSVKTAYDNAVPKTTTLTGTSPITIAGVSGTGQDLSANRTIAVNVASTSESGVVQLSDSTSITSSVLAATPTAVKSAYDLANAAIPKSIVDAKGDLIVATAADTVARVAVGATNGQVLTVDSSTASGVAWATASGGGGGIVATVEDATTSLNLATTHLNDLVRMTSSSANNVNVTTALNTLADGSMIHIQQAGTGRTTIVATGVTVTTAYGLLLRARYSVATLIKIGGTGTNIWTLVGDVSAV